MNDIQRRLLQESLDGWDDISNLELENISQYSINCISSMAFWAKKYLEMQNSVESDMPPKGSDEMRMGIWLEDNYDRVVLGLEKLKESGESC